MLVFDWSGEDGAEGEFVEGDGILLLELGEVGFAVGLGAFVAQDFDEAGFDLLEGGGAGFADVEDLDDVPAVGQADGFRHGAFVGIGEAVANLGLDGGDGEPADFSSARGALGFLALVLGDGGEIGVGGLERLRYGVEVGLGVGVIGSDEDLGELVLLRQLQLILAGFVGGLEFGFAG